MARLNTCMKCKKVGHFAKVCKTKEEDTIRPRKRNIHQVTKDDDFAFTLQSSGKDCRNRLHCFITKLISDIGHCVLFDIFLFNRFDHARFFCNNVLISMFFDGANWCMSDSYKITKFNGVSNTIIIWHPKWGPELLDEYDDHDDCRKKRKINTIASDPWSIMCYC